MLTTHYHVISKDYACFMVERESEILEAYKKVQRTGKRGRLLKNASMTPPQPKHASTGKPNYYQNTETKTENPRKPPCDDSIPKSRTVSRQG